MKNVIYVSAGLLRSALAIIARVRLVGFPAEMVNRFGAMLLAYASAPLGPMLFRTHYEVECFDPAGALKWKADFWNLVVNEGLDDNLDKYFKGSAYTAGFFVGLTDASPSFAPGDTMLTNPSWDEFVTYSEADRPALTLGTVASQSVDNSASKANYTISANGQSIGGAFVTTDNTKGGTTGTLYGGGAFTQGNKGADLNDTLAVTVTLTASAA